MSLVGLAQLVAVQRRRPHHVVVGVARHHDVVKISRGASCTDEEVGSSRDAAAVDMIRGCTDVAPVEADAGSFGRGAEVGYTLAGRIGSRLDAHLGDVRIAQITEATTRE